MIGDMAHKYRNRNKEFTMANHLVIVESPAKVKTIKKFLGSNYEVDASGGHVRDLPKSQLGFDPEHDYEPKYITIRGKGDVLAKLRKEVKKADKIYLATDPDREGEAISWHLAQMLNLNMEDNNRVAFNEITQAGVRNGMSHPHKIDVDLVNAQQARRILDRIVGYQLSPFLWKKVKRGLSAGRVQSVAVRLVVDRENEIRAFKTQEYWSIDAKLTAPSSRKVFAAKLATIDGQKAELATKEQTDGILQTLEQAQFTVAGVKKRVTNKQPAPPFITSTLQQDASRRGSRVAVIAGIVCIALAVIVICYFLYNYFFSGLFGRTEETAVPRLIGLNAEQIRAEDYPDFVIQIDGYVESSQYEAGVVVDQSPLPEKQAKVGSTIKLTVSSGVSETKMPPLVNLTRQNAEQQLNALGLNLNIQIEERKDDIYTEGYVIQTDPASGSALTSGQTVTLTVSLGPDVELIEVPTLVGEDVDKALQMIADAGLQNGSIRSDDSDLPAGTVTFQSIDGGQMVKKDTVINLRVSKGPQEAAIPVVTNLTQDQAVLQDESVTLSISAYSTDDGTLRYAWYMSTNGSYENAALVSRSREGNTTCEADTSVPGTYYYFCVVENSLGDDTKTTKSNMIEVVVQEKTVEKTIEINLPGKSGLYEITVYVDGVLQYGPTSVSITDDRSMIVEVTVRGKGTLPVDVYLDGAIYDSQLILFE